MMVRRDRDYDCRMLEDGEYNGYDIYKIYFEPNNEDEVIRLGIRSGEAWVEKNTFAVIYSLFNSISPNEQVVIDSDKWHWVDGVFSSETRTVTSFKDGRPISTSYFKTYDERYNIGLPERWFSPEHLGSGDESWLNFHKK